MLTALSSLGRTFRVACLATVSLMVLVAPSQAKAGRPNLVELAQSAPDLSILVEAVIRADLVGALSGPDSEKLTVFAPTNAAFLALLDELHLTSLDDVPTETLEAILLDHVVARELDPRELHSLKKFRALGRLKLHITDGATEVNGIPILAGGLEANNGTVYVIDGVLLP